MISFDSPRLIADIGGLYARFAIESAYGEFSHQKSLRCADFPSFQAAVTAYLEGLKSITVAHAAVAIANPVEGDFIRMTNYHWQFSIEATRLDLGLDTLVVVNDFTALAMALPRLAAQDFRQVGGGQAVKHSVIGLIGSGSGLGAPPLVVRSSRAFLAERGGLMYVCIRMRHDALECVRMRLNAFVCTLYDAHGIVCVRMQVNT